MTSTAMPTRTARGRTSRRRKVSTGIALLVGLFVGLIGLAPSASAHHPEISATTGCADGTHKITYTATSWASPSASQGRHDNIQISYSLNGGAFQYHATGAFTQANGGSFSGSISLPLATTGSIVVKATDVGDWENGADGGNPRQTASLALKTNCAPPADPSATAGVDCPNDEIDLAITGKGSATTVDIYKNGVKVKDDLAVPVGASSYSIPLVAADENTTVVVKLDYAVGTDQTLNVTVNCDLPAAPSASVSWECGENAVVRLNNQGGEPITAIVTRNGSAVHTVVLAPGATTTREVLISAADEDTDVVIKVMFSDDTSTTDVTKKVSVNCTTPEPHVGTPVCAANGILIPLTNTGTQSVTFTVDSPVLGNPDDVVVGPGGSSSITLPVAEDATTSVSIKVGVTVIYSNQALKRDCEKPVANVTFECAAGGVVVKLTNAGPNPAIVPVNGENVTVPGNTTSADPVIVEIPVAEGAAYDITVLGQQAAGVRDCEKPAATVEFDCAAGGVEVSLSNGGSLPTTIKVNGTDHVIPAGGSSSFVVAVAEGADYDVTVTGDDNLSKQAKGTRDCENPAATVTFTCAAGGVVVKLTNDGVLDTKVDVDGEQVTVPAGTTSADPVTRTIAVAEGAAYDITVLGQQAAGVRDCEKPAATVEFDCAAGGVEVSLSNGGSLPTTIKVNGTDHVIPAGGSSSFVVAVAEGADYDVTVTGDDNLSKQAKGTRDCEKPVVTSAELVCAEGGVVVVLTNSGERDTDVTVGGQTVTVPKNGTTSVTIPVAEGDAYDVKIKGDGIDQSVAGTRDCENPAVVSAEVVCAEGGVVVQLINPDPSGADTTVTVNGSELFVPAGTTADAPVAKLVTVAENATYTIVVLGDELEETFTGTRNCEQPKVDAAQVVCAEGGVAVTLSNSGKADTTVTVAGTPVLVPAGSTARVVVPVAENATYDFLVEGDELSQRVTGTRDCQLPELVVDEVVCAAGGLNAVLRNTGTDTGTFVVTSPALPGGVLQETVAAGASKAVLIPMAEDTSTTVRVTAGDKVLYDSTVTRDCEQVEGVQVTPQVQAAQAMPRTGSDLNGLLATGGAGLGAGGALGAGWARGGTV